MKESGIKINQWWVEEQKQKQMGFGDRKSPVLNLSLPISSSLTLARCLNSLGVFVCLFVFGFFGSKHLGKPRTLYVHISRWLFPPYQYPVS